MPDSPLKRLVGLRSEHKWLESAVDAHLGRPGIMRADKGWFHPSQLSSTCDAYLAFAFLGVEGREQISPRLQRIFDNGSARDKDIKRYVSEIGVSLAGKPKWGACPKCGDQRVDLKRHICITPYRIRGEFDDRIKHITGNEIYVLEIKTMNSEQWQALKEPTPDHKIQVHPYAFATEDYQTIVLYENKNTQEWKTFLQKFDWPLWNSITERLGRIIQDLRNGHVNRTPIANDSQCPFYYMCSVANPAKLLEESELKL